MIGMMAAIISHVLNAGLHNQLCAHLPRSAFDFLCIGNLESAMVGVFTLWELANTTNFT